MGLTGLLRIALIAFLAWLAFKALRGLFLKASDATKARTAPRRDQPDVVDVMVKDPQCGTYLPQSEAIKEQDKGDTLYFCSEKCRKEYLSK